MESENDFLPGLEELCQDKEGDVGAGETGENYTKVGEAVWRFEKPVPELEKLS